MTLTTIGQGVDVALGIILIARLLMLRLHRVYSVFCLFLIVNWLGSAVFVFRFSQNRWQFDYRTVWIGAQVAMWFLYLWIVYSLLQAMLVERLQGILKFSNRLIYLAFIFATAVGVISGNFEYSPGQMENYHTLVDRIVPIFVVTDRVVSSIALLVLVAILLFILWFPIEMRRNLAVFSVGFIFYFAALTSLLLLSHFAPWLNRTLLNDVMTMVEICCFTYWIVFITKEGEKVTVSIGHSWNRQQQDLLLERLEAMNASLLHSPGQ
jgi:hypothetical protein